MKLERIDMYETRKQARESVKRIYAENLFGAAEPPPPGTLRGIDVLPAADIVHKLARALQIALSTRGRYLNYTAPQTYFEKLVLSKFFAPVPMPSPADKIACAEYIPEDLRDVASTIPPVWTGNTPITPALLDTLSLAPGTYYAKSNTGCTTNYSFSIPPKDDQLERLEQYSTGWLKRIHGVRAGEWWYSMIRNQNLIEADLSPKPGESLVDWKFHACRGRVFAAQVDQDRATDHRQLIFDRDFNFVPEMLFFQTGEGLPRPENYDLILKVAEAISKPFEYARVDLYLVEDRIYLGEITLAPVGGQRLPISADLDLWMGQRWKGGIFDEVTPRP